MSTDAVLIPRSRPMTVKMTADAPASLASVGLGRVQQTDEELAMHAQQGSMSAFAELVGRLETRLYNFLLRRVANPADAEDLTQETFLRCWLQIHRYRPRCRFSTWLFTIGSRLAVDHHRGRPRLVLHPHASDSLEIPANPKASTTAGVVQDIWGIAAQLLTAQQHSALWLRYAEGLSNREIARVLGRTSIGVRVMLHRARSTLAKHVNSNLRTGEER